MLNRILCRIPHSLLHCISEPCLCPLLWSGMPLPPFCFATWTGTWILKFFSDYLFFLSFRCGIWDITRRFCSCCLIVSSNLVSCFVGPQWLEQQNRIVKCLTKNLWKGFKNFLISVPQTRFGNFSAMIQRTSSSTAAWQARNSSLQKPILSWLVYAQFSGEPSASARVVRCSSTFSEHIITVLQFPLFPRGRYKVVRFSLTLFPVSFLPPEWKDASRFCCVGRIL